MACRNQKKANNARNDILQEIGDYNDEENLIFIRLDLGDLKTIDEFVMNYKQNKIINQRLDILINNAGVMVCNVQTNSRNILKLYTYLYIK